MQSQHQFQRAHASAQFIHDTATPPCLPDPFLETDAGSDWLYTAVNGLVQGDALVIKSRTVSAMVTPQALYEAIGTHMADHQPTGFELEQILTLIAARGRRDNELFTLLLNLFGLSKSHPEDCHQWSFIHDLAEGLISPLADDACRAARENDEEDGSW